MKKTAIFFTMLAFLASFLFSSDSNGYYSYSYARLSYVKGDVFVQRSADLGYEEGVVNLPIVQGDKLGTREGRAEIHFGKKNYLRADYYTQVDFATLPKQDYDQIKLHLLSGSIFLRISFLDREKDFEVHTPDGSFYILAEGLYRLKVRENQETELLVYSGAVEAAAEEGSLLVEEEQRLIVANGSFRSSPTIFYADLEDSFYQWNEYRDSLVNRRVAKRYLPAELYEYEAELAFHGRWVYEWPYGHVWIPRVYHYEWRPYYYGRWVWFPFIGWNWVSYDPWGWCVHHYGRWHWRAGLGWYWIPSRIWGPGWVHWYRGYDYIGWCPLNYYGRPVVVINNIFYERYHGSHYPHHSRALTVIHKNHLRARNVSEFALNQNQVKRLGKISLSSTQPRVRPAIKHISTNTVAAQTLSRTNLRRVGKGYASEKALSSPARLKSSLSRSSLKTSQNRLSSTKNRTASKVARESSSSRKISGIPTQHRSSSSLSKSETLVRTPSRSSIKTYPSRRISSTQKSPSISKMSSSSRSSSSRSRIKSYDSQSYAKQNSSSQTSRSGSSKELKFKSSVKSYPPTKSYSRSSSSKDYSKREASSRVKSYSQSRSSSSPRYSSVKTESPFRSYKPSSRSSKSPSRSYTKSYSSSSRRSPSLSYKSSSRSYKSSSSSYSKSRSSSKSSISRKSASSSRSAAKSHSSSRSTTSSSSRSKSKKK